VTSSSQLTFRGIFESCISKVRSSAVLEGAENRVINDFLDRLGWTAEGRPLHCEQFRLSALDSWTVGLQLCIMLMDLVGNGNFSHKLADVLSQLTHLRVALGHLLVPLGQGQSDANGCHDK
jgi:hypothetical protein